jgi:hypothetical protein
VSKFNWSRKLIMIVSLASSVLGCVNEVDKPADKVSETQRNSIFISSNKASYTNVDDVTKAEVIKVWLKRIDKNDHFVTDERVVYLAVAEDVYKLLPKKVNDLQIKRYIGSIKFRENEVPYILFTNWSRRGNYVWLTGTAYFVGGNVGGCNVRYDWKEGKGWNNSESECFAAAS